MFGILLFLIMINDLRTDLSPIKLVDDVTLYTIESVGSVVIESSRINPVSQTNLLGVK